MNTTTPRGLLRAVFYTVGKCFCLRGGQEHRNLTISQFERLHDPDSFVYRENASKNKQGGLKQLKMDHKVVEIVTNPVVKERCPVYILDLYFSKLPSKAKENDLFYCRPLEICSQTSAPWFAAVAVGKNTLQTMVQDMCKEAGVSGKKTNHSLRVSGATSLYSAGVPEKLIQSRTGHSSLEALRKYERVTDDQEQAVSKILSGESESFKKANDVKANDRNFSSSGAVQCKDCVVNIYQNSPMAQPSYFHYGYYPLPPYPSMPPSTDPSSSDHNGGKTE